MDETSLPRESDTFLPPRRERQYASARLQRTGYILVLVLVFIALALCSWIVICIQVFRPLTANRYGVWVWDDGNGYGFSDPKAFHALYVKNERWYHAARVVQSIVSLVTLPLTSAVCSSAAVIFMQRRQWLSSRDLTIRQTMVLADKGWTDLLTYARLHFVSSGWKRYGSPFLFFAIGLNGLASTIGPLRELFLSPKTIKVPTQPRTLFGLLDIPDQWNAGVETSDVDVNTLLTVMTREALTATMLTQPQANIWQATNVSCSALDANGFVPESCSFKGATFQNVSELDQPFLAELPSDYNTGLIRQSLQMDGPAGRLCYDAHWRHAWKSSAVTHGPYDGRRGCSRPDPGLDRRGDQLGQGSGHARLGRHCAAAGNSKICRFPLDDYCKDTEGHEI
ncbi:hypothetical protein BO78DRAFT_395536 [Aspergillus sclerotiicarbonarius CBS 121057]|uniref:Uncharacterized protein n=1 Tax=Aspergillus sclerotiicarbonarius (strain CBS 121057 / IBT 28362) TaxID=1448318 RepID=A0A319EEK2_ASPSB|nr:hypothetical protein BO78DRAFT_395536 [Aspergillus sclerotiicarbonarius CBS 121057]